MFYYYYLNVFCICALKSGQTCTAQPKTEKNNEAQMITGPDNSQWRHS